MANYILTNGGEIFTRADADVSMTTSMMLFFK